MHKIRLLSVFIFIIIILSGIWGCTGFSEREISFWQRFDSGKVFYETHCANCHKSNGQGLGTLYPPIANSDYLHAHSNELACIIYNGMKGSVTVNRVKYNWQMPDNKRMDEIQMAAILTYVQSRWGGNRTSVSYEQARKAINECGKAGIRYQVSGASNY